MAKKTSSIDEYMSGMPRETKNKLNAIRVLVLKSAPKAEERISYSMPSYNLDGHYLIYFAAYAKHIGMYPVPVGLPDYDKLFSPYKTSGKGAIQFPLDQPLPLSLITKIIKYRLKVMKAKVKN